jgi:hypothetical protein
MLVAHCIVCWFRDVSIQCQSFLSYASLHTCAFGLGGEFPASQPANVCSLLGIEDTSSARVQINCVGMTPKSGSHRLATSSAHKFVSSCEAPPQPCRDRLLRKLGCAASRRGGCAIAAVRALQGPITCIFSTNSMVEFRTKTG